MARSKAVNAMREMKDSGMSFIGYIPTNWQVDKIKHHLLRFEVRNPGNKQILSVYREYGVIPKDSRDDNHNVTSDDTTKYKYVMPDYFVINKMKAWQGSMGISQYEGVVSPAYFVYKFTDKIFHLKYFHYLLRNCYKDEFRRLSGGIREGQWDLPAYSFENTMVLIPSYSEQKSISDFLDSKCAQIDALSSDIQTQIDTLEQYKRSVISEAVTRGLDPNVPMKDSGIEWVEKIPSHWMITRFKYIAKIKSNLVSPYNYMDHPQISPDNIQKNSGKLLSYSTVEESGVISGNHLFFKGQILYSKIRPNLNKVTIAPFNGLCSADMYPIETKSCTKFVLYLMLSNYFVEQVSVVIHDRVKMPKINQEELGEISVFVPDEKGQQTIADYLDAKCAEIDQTIAQKQEQLDTLADYKKSLIYEYVTGKKEVPGS